MDYYTQWTNAHPTERAALDALNAMRAQSDFVCGRVLDRETKYTPEHRYLAQAFFPDCGHEAGLSLPDEMRRVMVPDALLRQCKKFISI